jgi:F-type H+-transporting ATPase subunit delta
MIAPASQDIPPRTTALGEIYAAALLPLAAARDQARGLLEELERAAVLLDEEPEFATWIAHPGVTAAEKLHLVEKAFRHHISDLTCDALLVICRHGRLAKLDEIVQAYRQRLEAAEGRLRVDVVSAAPLDDAARRQREAVLTEWLQRTPILKLEVDADLLGGLIVQAGDQRLDLSLRGQIEQLRQALYEKARLVAHAGAAKP